MFFLVGTIQHAHYVEDHDEYLHCDEEVVVATFTEEQDAIDYVEKSTLKRLTEYQKPFKKTSLLRRYKSACVQNVSFFKLPHNPKQKK